MKRLAFLLIAIFAISALQAQSETTTDTIPRKRYFTNQIVGTAPVIDGKLEDPAWNQVEWSGDFTQRQPYENKPPTQETQFKILYDAKNIYIGFRCFDTEPDKIVRRMSRRDGFEGDWVEINIDSYNDERSAFSFTMSASGVKGDEFISNNGDNWDDSWDPIWFMDTNLDDQGWTAEARIPLSQIRYGNNEVQEWGIQVTRRDFRMEERSVWQYIPQNHPTWVSDFGELHGIKGIKPQRQIELQPYVVAQTATFEKEEGNPFRTGASSRISTGLDGKFGVTSDLVLDFTINPDFGQVEADPGAIALDGFEIFFRERRPFFVENRNLFDFYVSDIRPGGPFSQDNLFYSRRIGGSPKSYPDVTDDEYVNSPNATSILGAAKFSGKTKNGLGIAILESVTAREFAKIDSFGVEKQEEVEPLTNYFIGRLTQDFDGGNTVIGGMFTATNRELSNPNLQWLNQSAYSGAFDILHKWNKQKWYTGYRQVFSNINGTEEAILNAQTSLRRSFNRPFQDYMSVDSSRTSMTGTGGTFKFGKNQSGHKSIGFETGLTYRSPMLELNDVGFMRNSDDIVHFMGAGMVFNKPTKLYRRMNFNYNHWLNWDFGGNFNVAAWNLNTYMNFKNNSSGGAWTWFSPYTVVNTALQGGPALRLSNAFNYGFWYSTDDRKKFAISPSVYSNEAINGAQNRKGFNLWMRYRPSNMLEFSVRPGYNKNRKSIQFIDNIEGNDGETRYLVGKMVQETFSATLRANLTILPNLTVQYYGEPFISKGNFSEFKKVVDAKAPKFEDRYENLESVSWNTEDEHYDVDDNDDRGIDFNFGDPDFNYMQFRSNLVMRWEYIPGSELYLVWSQGTTNSGTPNEPLFDSLSANLFSNKLENIFLVKATYRFLR